VKDGATVVLGGKRNASFIEPTVLENVKDGSIISCEEVFGPVCFINNDFKAAVKEVNSSRYGLQAGHFSLTILTRPFMHMKILNCLLRLWTFCHILEW